MHSEAKENGESKSTESYMRKSKNGKVFAVGDANVLTSKSLECQQPRTFKDELHMIIASWRIIYGKLPWAELAAKYEQDQSVTASQIEQKRQATNITVNILTFFRVLISVFTFFLFISTEILPKRI